MLRIQIKEKYQYLFKTHEEIGLQEHDDPKAFIEY